MDDYIPSGDRMREKRGLPVPPRDRITGLPIVPASNEVERLIEAVGALPAVLASLRGGETPDHISVSLSYGDGKMVMASVSLTDADDEDGDATNTPAE